MVLQHHALLNYELIAKQMFEPNTYGLNVISSIPLQPMQRSSGSSIVLWMAAKHLSAFTKVG